MKTCELDPNLRVPETTLERSPAASLSAEIAERLLELCEVQGEAKTQRWLLRVAALAGNSTCPRAVWFYLRLATGDLGELTASHREHGEAMHRSKQGEHKEHALALEVIGKMMPEVRVAIEQLRGIANRNG